MTAVALTLPGIDTSGNVTADELKAKLYGRHPGYGGQMPGPWTCIEELHGIDLVAFAAWSRPDPKVPGVTHPRVGYEIKVSRSDLRRELLRPGKRSRAVAWCHEFYFAVPKGLLTKEELAFEEPDWPEDAFTRKMCPNWTTYRWRRRGKKSCSEEVPVPRVLNARYESYSRYGGGLCWESIPCRTCDGRGYLEKSQVENEAPTCWVPRDVGLIEIDGRGCRKVKVSPVRKDVPTIDHHALAQIVRWISMRPDPRHHLRRRIEREELSAREASH